MWRAPKAEPNFKEVTLRYIDEGKVAILSINRPKKHNAIAWDHLFQLKECLEYLGRTGSEVRAIVLTGEGKNFTAGIDFMMAAPDLVKLNEKAQETDPARAAVEFFPVVEGLQDCISAMERVRVPVIAAIHGLCLGLGNDVITAADIRICTSYSKFTIKEIKKNCELFHFTFLLTLS